MLARVGVEHARHKWRNQGPARAKQKKTEENQMALLVKAWSKRVAARAFVRRPACMQGRCIQGMCKKCCEGGRG